MADPVVVRVYGLGFGVEFFLYFNSTLTQTRSQGVEPGNT